MDNGRAPAAGAAPIIVSALFGAADLSFFDGLRRAHFPPDRNVLTAHLTLFHHLPPSIAPELNRRLAEEARAARPAAMLAAPYSLGRGVAYRLDTPGLEAIRARLADAFAPLLTPQDAQRWRPHVTVQNKVDATAARALLAMLTAGFAPRPVVIAGLASWWYRGGPWELIARHSFRG